MTRDTINRAVASGTGGDDNDNMDEVNYEGYGIGGVAVLVETLTDNLNRTVSEVRHTLPKTKAIWVLLARSLIYLISAVKSSLMIQA